MEKLSVYLCTGCDIGKALTCDDLEEVCTESGAGSFTTHPCLCNEEGVDLIKKAIDADETDGVVIAACSHRAKISEFTFDATKVQVERVCLREQVAWTHPHGDEDTQMLAADLLRMGLAKAADMKVPLPMEEEIDRTVMVVGGGLAGLNAAQAAAGMGHPVVVLDNTDELGGYMRGVKDLIPEEPPYDQVHPNKIGELVAAVEGNSNVKVHFSARIKKIDGQPGQFAVELESGETFMVGAIVQATGSRPYDASKLEHLGYGKSPIVMTSNELEKMLVEGALIRPSDKQTPRRVLFIQCAGSRDEAHLPYCSGECCATSLKQVAVIKRDFPEVETSVVYRDLRAPGQLEHFYLGVQEQSQAMFSRGVVESVSGNGNGPLTIKLSESLLGDDVELEADLVVLATGMVPNSADSEAIRQLRDAKVRLEKKESDTQVKLAEETIEQLKHHEGTHILNLTYRQGPDLPMLKYDFPDSHYICFPYETRRTGIYAAGTMRAPMDAAQAAEDGWGAAMKAVQCIEAATRGETVHPRAGDQGVAEFSLQRCTQCKRCTEECPFGAINEDEKGTPEYNQLRCRRCGICLGACPERIISFPDFSVAAVSNMVKAIEVPEEDDEKPRMVAFMCENDAIPALDEAAARGMKWNPWIRIIPMRCLGDMNTVWIADALSGGIDGVMLIGCKHGDDYQCHYIKGSELANTRMSNVQETLERLALESERIKIVELSRNEFERIPALFEEFAETIEEVGPNPYKGW